jgi:hypothetical protein
MNDDLISRQAAVNALWKALFGYEDKTEKQFTVSDELDVADWIGHRIFVENMSDIDRQTILALPSVQPEQWWIPCSERLPEKDGHYLCSFKMPKRIDKIYVGLAYRTYGRWYGYMDNEIIAWMPLPEPYKEESWEKKVMN